MKAVIRRSLSFKEWRLAQAEYGYLRLTSEEGDVSNILKNPEQSIIENVQNNEDSREERKDFKKTFKMQRQS